MARLAPVTSYHGPGDTDVEVLTDEWALCVGEEGLAFVVGVDWAEDERGGAVPAPDCHMWVSMTPERWH